MAHTLVSANFEFTEANTSGGVLFERNINPDANFHLGGAAMGKIEFTILDYDDSILQNRVVYPIVFNDGVTYWTLADGTKVGIFQRSESVDILGEEFLYTQDGVQIGYFTVDSIERVDSLKVKVTAYDRMKLFESSADEWLAGLTLPMSITAMLNSLVANVGITRRDSNSLNASYSIPKGFYATGVTYRDVLNWLCEIRGQFAYINANGVLRTEYYTTTATSYDASATMGTTVAEYNILPFQSVQIQASDNDIGVTVGSGSPKYVITGNPLLMNGSTTALKNVAQNLLGRVGSVSYTPATFTIWQDTVRPLRAGQIVNVKTPHNPTDGYTVYIMSERHINQQHTAECFGTQDNIQRRSASTQIKQLAGKTAELTYDVNELKSTYSDATTGLQSQITQNAEAIELRVVRNRVADALNNYNQRDSEGSIIKIKQSAIDIQGLVKFSNLSTAGQTTINGGNITTGTIDANKVKVTNIDASQIKTGSLSADRISGGTIDADSINVTNLNASNIKQGTLSGSLVGDGISANYISGGTLATARLDKGQTADYLSGDNYLCKTRGTFRGSVFYDGGGGLYKQSNGRVTIDGGGYPIFFLGGSVIFSLGGGTITVNGRPTFNYGIQGPLTIYGSYTATGTKNALVETEHYGKRKTYCYEMSEVLFGDIGEGEVKGGRCEIVIDPIFAETVNTEKPYQVFLTPYGRGQIWVSERLPDKFIVEGDDIKFGFEIKAKRRGFEEVRLEEYKESETNA